MNDVKKFSLFGFFGNKVIHQKGISYFVQFPQNYGMSQNILLIKRCIPRRRRGREGTINLLCSQISFKE